MRAPERVDEDRRAQQPPRSLGEIERLRGHLWVTALVALALISAVIVVMSYWTDVVPDSVRDAVDFAGWRFAFLVITLGFIVYAVGRERSLRRLSRRTLEEHERSLALRAELKDLADLERFRRDIVSNVTHELKTPLTSLLGYTTIMRKRARTMSDAERDEMIDILERQGHRILRLIEELLQSSRVDSGELRLQRVSLDVAQIVRTCAREIAAVRERPIEVEAPAGDLGVFGDPSAMEHVVINLIDNACKYAPEGAVRAHVVEGEGEVFVQVSDEGEGIAPEDLPHIFERHRQAASDGRDRASVGLGLYIVHNLVAAHGGRVWADSELGKGTTFTIALPRRRER